MRIAREALPFVAVAGVLALAAAWWTPWAALPPLLVLAFCLWFFRDPTAGPRRTPRP